MKRIIGVKGERAYKDDKDEWDMDIVHVWKYFSTWPLPSESTSEGFAKPFYCQL